MDLWLVTWACYSETAQAAVVDASGEAEAKQRAADLNNDEAVAEAILKRASAVPLRKDLLVETHADY